MPHVSVTINGCQYRMACDDGQEHHLGRLAHDLDQRISHLRGTFGEIGDMRLTIMAALILADELSEARQRMRKVEEEFAGLQQSRAAATNQAQSMQEEVAAAIDTAAERIEKAVKLLGEPREAHQAALG
jgi:cell division protein ZapA